ncbi:protein turtle homolog B isoform X2 [Drosophila bipectinata]|uniref:protein turtle homolog B isoform X2 n=1 Tax=Drosophila bipectinata TaxID=42026 RepID=UPI001C8AF249|nr:protein turtle homolog B isoform X2 [Drosophila bipectinata]
MKLHRKREMSEISSRLIVAAASVICLTVSLTLCTAQENDDEDGVLHHLDMHHQQQDFIIGESEERDHIAHHLAEMQNKDELLEDIREDTVVNAIPEKVPPDILDYPTSTDMVIREGSNVTLKCAATGSPTPTITWRREGGEVIPLPNGVETVAYNGSFLTIAKVNRLNMGAYLCIASNGIPPTVSKRVMLIVHFPPMIWIQNQLVGAALNQNITLECQSEAYPKSINYWMKNDTIIVPGERFVPETFDSGYKITMRLTIYDVDIQDFGAYRCVAKNSLGDTDGGIKLYHIPQTTTMTTMAPTVSINTVPVVIVKYNKEQRYSSNNNQNANSNPYNFNSGNNQQNTKLQRNKPNGKGLDQSPSGVNNFFVGATSSLWNTQDHYGATNSRGRDYHQQQQQPQHHGPDHGSIYRSDGKIPQLIKHDAKSLTDDLDRIQDLKSGGQRIGSFLAAFPVSLLAFGVVYSQTW